ncbi:hypothetical protein ADUPG1_012801 [Aduncisulcus paluster]|uniref:Uncharacterized protein n=1 Tax=Aduncisulcus paluster TaxID=2918883 RepID=A0ABQ5K4D9_9EUKA|nr:hypothetical protein ADUPG1_012801 [Aduncisulcus paluster]
MCTCRNLIEQWLSKGVRSSLKPSTVTRLLSLLELVCIHAPEERDFIFETIFPLFDDWIDKYGHHAEWYSILAYLCEEDNLQRQISVSRAESIKTKLPAILVHITRLSKTDFLPFSRTLVLLANLSLLSTSIAKNIFSSVPPNTIVKWFAIFRGKCPNRDGIDSVDGILNWARFVTSLCSNDSIFPKLFPRMNDYFLWIHERIDSSITAFIDYRLQVMKKIKIYDQAPISNKDPSGVYPHIDTVLDLLLIDNLKGFSELQLHNLIFYQIDDMANFFKYARPSELGTVAKLCKVLCLICGRSDIDDFCISNRTTGVEISSDTMKLIVDNLLPDLCKLCSKILPSSRPKRELDENRLIIIGSACVIVDQCCGYDYHESVPFNDGNWIRYDMLEKAYRCIFPIINPLFMYLSATSQPNLSEKFIMMCSSVSQSEKSESDAYKYKDSLCLVLSKTYFLDFFLRSKHLVNACISLLITFVKESYSPVQIWKDFYTLDQLYMVKPSDMSSQMVKTQRADLCERFPRASKRAMLMAVPIKSLLSILDDDSFCLSSDIIGGIITLCNCAICMLNPRQHQKMCFIYVSIIQKYIPILLGSISIGAEASLNAFLCLLSVLIDGLPRYLTDISTISTHVLKIQKLCELEIGRARAHQEWEVLDRTFDHWIPIQTNLEFLSYQISIHYSSSLLPIFLKTTLMAKCFPSVKLVKVMDSQLGRERIAYQGACRSIVKLQKENILIELFGGIPIVDLGAPAGVVKKSSSYIISHTKWIQISQAIRTIFEKTGGGVEWLFER